MILDQFKINYKRTHPDWPYYYVSSIEHEGVEHKPRDISARSTVRLGDYFLKFSEAYDGNQCKREWEIWQAAQKSHIASYLVPTLEYGQFTSPGERPVTYDYVIQPFIQVRDTAHHSWMKRLNDAIKEIGQRFYVRDVVKYIQDDRLEALNVSLDPILFYDYGMWQPRYEGALCLTS